MFGRPDNFINSVEFGRNAQNDKAVISNSEEHFCFLSVATEMWMYLAFFVILYII